MDIVSVSYSSSTVERIRFSAMILQKNSQIQWKWRALTSSSKQSTYPTAESNCKCNFQIDVREIFLLGYATAIPETLLSLHWIIPMEYIWLTALDGNGLCLGPEK